MSYFYTQCNSKYILIVTGNILNRYQNVYNVIEFRVLVIKFITFKDI